MTNNHKVKTPKQLIITDICNSIESIQARIACGDVDKVIGTTWINTDKKALYSLAPDLFTEYKNIK